MRATCPGAAPRVRRRSYGESFTSCLLMIVVVLGGLMWAYFHFFQNRELVNAGNPGQYGTPKDPTTIQARQSSIEYQRHMREAGLGSTDGVLRDTIDFIDRARAGKYSDKNDFEQRWNEIMRELRDNISDLNSRDVPATFNPGHHNLCLAHKYLYEAVQLAYKAYYETDQPGDVKKDYADARKLADKAWGLIHEGTRFITSHYG